MHSTVRQKWLDGDKFIRSSMEEVGELALEGREVLLQKNFKELAMLMNRNFDLRRYVTMMRTLLLVCLLNGSILSCKSFL